MFALGRIGAEVVIIGNAIAGMEMGDSRPDRDDLAGRLIAGYERQPRRLVEPVAEIDVDEVEPDGVLADADLARSGAGRSTAS